MQLAGHCSKTDGTVTMLQSAAHFRRRIKPNALRCACNWPAWHFVIWILLFSFILKMQVARSSKISVYVYICQTTWRHMREDTVIFCALGISNFVTCSFNFCSEEDLTLSITQAEGPATVGCSRLLTEYMYNHFPYLELLSLTCDQRTRSFDKVPLTTHML